jgi:hypothetical protein
VEPQPVSQPESAPMVSHGIIHTRKKRRRQAKMNKGTSPSPPGTVIFVPLRKG